MNEQDRHRHILELVEGWVTLLARDTEKDRPRRDTCDTRPVNLTFISLIYSTVLLRFIARNKSKSIRRMIMKTLGICLHLTLDTLLLVSSPMK